MEKDMEKEESGYLGLIIVIWAFCSFIAAVILSIINELYALIAFGQMFFIIGIVGIISAIKSRSFSITDPISLTILLCVLTGFFMIFIPILYINPNIFGIYINPNWFYPRIFIYVPLYFGFFLFVLYFNEKKQYNNEKLIRVSAVICELKENFSDIPKTHYAVLEYSFNGTDYKYDAYNLSNLKNAKVGDVIEVKVDPEDPNTIYYNSKGELLALIIGILLIVGSTIAIFVF